ncbi:NUDIX domain-containing protein [Kineococcus sp. SYSU DK002]|uniref:NUDIX domain-containing protein n=1 Tax=Kineococcus sp. SYSU DK002 TaxID=3383123 RepID=UPI003D7D7A13
MPRRSAGILLHRRTAAGGVELLLGHLGGPLWARKDERAWSIPKGEPEPGEELPDAARREFTEELGLPVPDVELVALGEARQSGGKVVTVWAGEADLDPAAVTPGTFTMVWPPRSGRVQEFPELDRVAWFPPEGAREKLVAGQVVFVDRLLELLGP